MSPLLCYHREDHCQQDSELCKKQLYEEILVNRMNRIHKLNPNNFILYKILEENMIVLNEIRRVQSIDKWGLLICFFPSENISLKISEISLNLSYILHFSEKVSLFFKLKDPAARSRQPQRQNLTMDFLSMNENKPKCKSKKIEFRIFSPFFFMI